MTKNSQYAFAFAVLVAGIAIAVVALVASGHRDPKDSLNDTCNGPYDRKALNGRWFSGRGIVIDKGNDVDNYYLWIAINESNSFKMRWTREQGTPPRERQAIKFVCFFPNEIKDQGVDAELTSWSSRN